MKKTHRAMVMGLALLLMAGAGWGAPRGLQGAQLSRIWAVNLSGDLIEVKVERTLGGTSEMETLLVGPERMVEVKRSAREEVSILDHHDLLLVTAPAGFDPAAVRVEGTAPGIERSGELRPPATLAKALAGNRLKRGEAVSSTVLWTGAEALDVRVGLHGAQPSAEVRVSRGDGPLLGYVMLSASRGVEVTVDLRGFLEESQYWGPVTKQVSVRRGEVSASLETADKRGSARRFQEKALGTAVYNKHVQYTSFGPVTSPLYYNVTGGPASTCGELNSYRNGAWLFGPGWLCTDASGNSTKGPWYTANANQKDDPTFIRWPGGTTTTNDWHIWDNNCPSATISNSPPPPNSWSGTAADTQWGACFTVSTQIQSLFHNQTTNLYWSSSTGTYSSSSKSYLGNLTNVMGCNASWSMSRPPLSAHVTGQTYRWFICVTDGGCMFCDGYTFTY